MTISSLGACNLRQRRRGSSLKRPGTASAACGCTALEVSKGCNSEFGSIAISDHTDSGSGDVHFQGIKNQVLCAQFEAEAEHMETCTASAAGGDDAWYDGGS